MKKKIQKILNSNLDKFHLYGNKNNNNYNFNEKQFKE